jgi:hypothetical protein
VINVAKGDEQYMRLAIEQATIAEETTMCPFIFLQAGFVPVYAVLAGPVE